MANFLTPKLLAQAIGASESSIRRWVDGGMIPITRTAGGHRRISWANAIRFIRSSGSTLVRPELLGFHNTAAPANSAGEQDDGRQLFGALHAGRLDEARGIVFSAYLTGRTPAALFDAPIREALARIGELWHEDPRGILIEHRALDICLQIVNQLRQTIPPSDAGAPVAIGGAPEGDTYVLPSMMAATVAAEAGFAAVNFGAETPVSLLSRAAKDAGARLIWLALSVRPSQEVQRQIMDLHAKLDSRHTALILGGRHANLLAGPKGRKLHIMSSMTEFAAFLVGLRV